MQNTKFTRDILRLTPSFMVGALQKSILTTAVCAGIGATSPASTLKPVHPNVIIILTDDQGWGDLSFNGNRNLQTPNIDRLAESGASFTHFFVSPVCSPTRAELLTGRYHPRSGVYSTSEGGERMNPDETTIARVFKNAGYSTAAFGKWHSGMQYPYHPNARGFDEFYGFCSGHWGDYFSPILEHNGRLVKGDGYITDDLTGKAIRFIEKNRNHPFFLYVPFNSPHAPMQVPDQWWDKFRDKPLELRAANPSLEKPGFTRAALAMCENIDWNVGRIVGKLKELNLEDNTIVLYFCDNGPNSHRWNGGMKGIKGSTDEGGIRSPLFIRWIGKIAPKTRIERIAAAIDLLPTLVDLAEIEYITPKPLDGVSLKPLLTGNEKNWKERIIFTHWNGRISARDQFYRYDHQGNLFDMKTDPGQLVNISDKKPEIAVAFKTAIQNWKADVFIGYPPEKRPFPVGHPEFIYTQLPARDAQAIGNPVRSCRHPNSSYYTNWTDKADKITWDAETLSEGNYRVEIQYTCPKGDEGSTVRLSFLDNELIFKINEAHDPPLTGMENDRAERTESYVKNFKSLDAGTIHLKKGRGTLALQAIDIPGKTVMDFRLMMLSRID